MPIGQQINPSLSLQKQRIRSIELTRYSGLGDGECFVKSDTFHRDDRVLRVDGHIRIHRAGVLCRRRVCHSAGFTKQLDMFEIQSEDGKDEQAYWI